MQEIYQITAALKALPHCGHVALLTDGRFSGVSTGPCIGHISPEALAGGPIGKLRDGDVIEIHIDQYRLEATVHLVEENGQSFTPEEGAQLLAARQSRAGLRPHVDLPDDTRLWAALVEASGGIWGGCVYDVEKIVEKLGESE
jgi:dihydroxyacid dehydratase/phosphogluconate dehydratase